MRGLTVLVAEPSRLRLALEIAAAYAAIGGRTRAFCQGRAVGALFLPDDDPGFAQAGLPTLYHMLDDALALGVEVIVCQTGLALCGIAASDLDPRLSFGGLVSVMQTLGEDRLVVA